jgi:predicted phosphoribosyltransferase
MLRKEGVAKIVLAVPVASSLAASRITAITDELICLLMPDKFQRVGDFYEDFHRIRDQEMFEYLNKSMEKSLPQGAGN